MSKEKISTKEIASGQYQVNKTPLDWERLCKADPLFREEYPTYPLFLMWAEKVEKQMIKCARLIMELKEKR